jgi:hypothetical protein
MKKTLLLLLSLSWVTNLPFNPVYGSKSERIFSLEIKNLNRWVNSPEATAIKQSLTTPLPEDIRVYSSILKKPFLLLDAEPNSFGGFFAFIVSKDYPNVLRVWIYAIEKNRYEIREVTPLPATLNKQIIQELKDKQIARFWLNSTK